MEKTQKLDFESSLKSLETENYPDRVFYRPIAFQIALLLRNTAITPNAVTIVSIFFGVGAGLLFRPENLWLNLAGFALLVIANMLDCVDGQLARLTGIKSQVGRILDGIAGDLWFVAIYICIALRLSPQIGTGLAWTLASLAGAANIVQANIVDYYKTLHLYFISLKKGAEFDSVEKVKARLATQHGINRAMYWLYLLYTMLQAGITPQLQKLLKRLCAKYGEDFPQEVRVRLRAESLKIIPTINIMTFNWQSVALLGSLIVGQMWIFLLWQIIVLSIVLVTAISRHEKMCKAFEI